MSSSRSLYKKMDLPETATQEEIRKQYLKLAKEKHPDKHKNSPEATAAFQKIQEAYSILSDPAKRETYDATLRQTKPTQDDLRRTSFARSPEQAAPSRAMNENMPPRRATGSPFFVPTEPASEEIRFHIFRDPTHVFQPPVMPRVVVISFVTNSLFDNILFQGERFKTAQGQSAQSFNIKQESYQNNDYLVAAARSREVMLNFMTQMLIANIAIQLAAAKMLEERSSLRETPRLSPFARRA